MGSDMTDVLHGMHLESLHDEYVAALEAFASSGSLVELKANILRLREAANEWGPEGFDGNEGLEKALSQIATLEQIYGELRASEKRSKRRFIIGTVLTILGSSLSGVGLFLTIRALL